MRVKELMVDDWYYWEAEGKKYPLQVTKDTFKLMDEDISNFQPIPITKEILEKNGFKKLENKCNYIIHNTLIFDDFTLALCTYDYNSITPYNHICYCRYVHELQHALKLCNIDRKIIV